MIRLLVLSNCLIFGAVCGSFSVAKATPARPGSDVIVVRIVGDITEEKADRWTAEIKAAGRSPVVVEFDSLGGSIKGASKMRSALLRTKSICVVTEKAASAALMALQGCQKRLMLPDARLIGHAPHWESTDGGADKLREISEEFALACTYRSKVTVEEWFTRTQGDGFWWMNAEAAVEKGFADVLAPSFRDVVEAVRRASK